MDIRNFWKKPRLDDSQNASDLETNNIENANNITVPFSSSGNEIEETKTVTEKKLEVLDIPITQKRKNKDELENFNGYNELDIGNFVNERITDEIRFKALIEPWIPPKDYDFKKDSFTARCFRYQWLNQYSCISYSALKKGVFCRICVLFRPHVRRGFQGGFIVKEFTKYKDFHESIKQHMKSAWHMEAVTNANNFQHIMRNEKLSVEEQIDSALHKIIQCNREKIIPIIKTIVFCGMHGLPIRGKDDDRSVFKNLLEFRVDSGDTILKNHFETCANNAKYVSHRIQNEIINICGGILRRHIIKDANNSSFFSILADESADISGIEQLSLAIRFVHKKEKEFNIREEFLGFVELEQMDAEYISDKIVKHLNDFGLDFSKVIGQGYDGASVMAGKISGVHKRIQEKYRAANFFPCASHKLNLVVNDLNDVPEIRNSIGCIKEVIRYFRESPLRRKEIPRIPLLCETRWTEKYKSIRIFKNNFISIINALHHLSVEGGNYQTRQRASQLLNSCTTPVFLVCLHIIAEYSAVLEPVANILQSIDQHILSVKKQIEVLNGLFEKDREDLEKFHNIMESVNLTAQELEVEIKVPRLTLKQKNRSNMPHDSVETYYRRSIFLPYIDSLIISLKERFSDNNESAFNLFKLIPKYMIDLSDCDYRYVIQKITEKYGCFLDNFSAEAQVWFAFWKQKSKNEVSNLNILDILNDAIDFYPSVYKALIIALSLPITTCTAERSFSTLRRVKTWIRSTIKEERLDALCMMNVHRDIIEDLGSSYYDEILDKFSQTQRRLQFLFSE